MDHLRLAWQAGETLLMSVPFAEDPEGTRYNVLLSIQELLTNVFRHGYRGDETQPLELTMRASAEEFAVEIRDRAPRFDPVRYQSRRPDSESAAGVAAAEGGGYGLVIVKMVMDEFEHGYEDGWNVVRATKGVFAKVGAGSHEDRA
jgi:anti-sigma regulatory factor (Ser/Thr protein kinase)